MPQPTLSDVHVDSLLTDISIAEIQSADKFIASKVFPSLGVAKQTNKFRKYTRNDLRRNDMKRLGPGVESYETGYGLSSDSYSCDVWALGHFVDEQVAANYDQPGDAEEDAAMQLAQLALINREVEWMTAFFAASIWTTDITPGVLWSAGGSDPKADVNTGIKTILQATGSKPNKLVLGYEVFQALQRHALIRDQFKYTSDRSLDTAMMANFFGVEEVLVSEASYATNNEGETAANAFIAGKHALLCHSAARPSVMMPSAGYTFEWTGLTGSAGSGTRVLRFEKPSRHGVKLEIQQAYDMKVTSADLGYFFASVVA